VNTASEAQTGLDARLQIKVRVKQQVPYMLTGQVRAAGKGTTAAPLSAYLRARCISDSWTRT